MVFWSLKCFRFQSLKWVTKHNFGIFRKFRKWRAWPIVEKPIFQNFSKVKISKISFVSSFERLLLTFHAIWESLRKLKISNFLKIFIETCSALDCEIFQNFNFSLGFSKKSQFWPFYRLENLLRECPIPELSEKLSFKLWELIWRAVVKKTQNWEKCMSGNI